MAVATGSAATSRLFESLLAFVHRELSPHSAIDQEDAGTVADCHRRKAPGPTLASCPQRPLHPCKLYSDFLAGSTAVCDLTAPARAQPVALLLVHHSTHLAKVREPRWIISLTQRAASPVASSPGSSSIGAGVQSHQDRQTQRIRLLPNSVSIRVTKLDHSRADRAGAGEGRRSTSPQLFASNSPRGRIRRLGPEEDREASRNG